MEKTTSLQMVRLNTLQNALYYVLIFNTAWRHS